MPSRRRALYRPGSDWCRSRTRPGAERQGHANRYLRWLLVPGVLSLIRRAKQSGHKRHAYPVLLLERYSEAVAAGALANKIARMIWVMMVRGMRCEEPVAQPVRQTFFNMQGE